MFGPLFGKELLELARRRRYYVARFVVGLALFVGWWLTFGGRQVAVEFGKLSLLSEVGRTLYEGWAAGAMLIGVLLAPALACGLIAGEKDNRTFDILLTTLLTNREILLGKIASRMAFFLTLLASSIPILALASLYGGFDAIQVAASAATVFVFTLLAMLVGLYYSTITFKPYVALLRAYFALAVLWLLLPALPNQEWWNVPFSPRIALASAANVMAENPGTKEAQMRWRRGPGGMIIPLGVKHPISPNGMLPMHNLAAALGVQLSLGGLLLWRTQYLLRRKLHPGKPPWIFRVLQRLYAAAIGGARGFVERRQRTVGLSQLWKAEAVSMRWAQARRAKIGDRNPLGLRNVTANVYDPERYITAFQLFACIGAVVVVAIVGYAQPSWLFDNSGFTSRMLSWAFVAHTVCSLVLAACAFARERQSGSWDLVSLADLPASEHWRSAFWGVFRVMRPLSALLLALWVLVCSLSIYREGVMEWLKMAASFWTNAVALALLASAMHARIAAAVAAAFGGLLGIAVAEAVFVVTKASVFAAAHRMASFGYGSWWWSILYVGATGVILFGVVGFVAWRYAHPFWRILLGTFVATRLVAAITDNLLLETGNAIRLVTTSVPHTLAAQLLLGVGDFERHPFFGPSWGWTSTHSTMLACCQTTLLVETVLLVAATLVFFPRLTPRRQVKRPAAKAI